jgi:hypothetical protein
MTWQLVSIIFFNCARTEESFSYRCHIFSGITRKIMTPGSSIYKIIQFSYERGGGHFSTSRPPIASYQRKLLHRSTRCLKSHVMDYFTKDVMQTPSNNFKLSDFRQVLRGKFWETKVNQNIHIVYGKIEMFQQFFKVIDIYIALRFLDRVCNVSHHQHQVRFTIFVPILVTRKHSG